MAPAQPSTALLHAVSHWLRDWSDFALAPAAPVVDTVAPGALTDPVAQTTLASNNGEAPDHWLATVQTPAPPVHWLALLDAHGLTWDADQGIAAQEAPSVEELSGTEAAQQESFAQKLPPAPPVFREQLVDQPEAKLLTGKPVATAPVAVNQLDQPAVGLSPARRRTPATNHQPRPDDLPVVEPLPANADGFTPDPPSNPTTPLVAWLTRLHEGVTALLSATTAGDTTADLPALLRTYAPVAPTPTTITTPARPKDAMPLPPTIAPGIEPNQPPPLVMTPLPAGEPSMPPAPMHQPVARRQTSEPPPNTPQRITRVHLRPPGMEQPNHNQPEGRSKDFSLSPATCRFTDPQMLPAPVLTPSPPESSGPDRITQKQPMSSAATPVRSQPAVQVTRLRVQAPGNLQTDATPASVQPAPSSVPPVPATRSLPVDGTPPAPIQMARSAKLVPPLPATSVTEAPVHPVAEIDQPSPVDEQATRLARIEALLTRLLAEQNTNGHHAVTPPAPVNNSVPPPRNHWPTLPERAARAERPPQRRSADLARRRRLAEEQRGRAWNG